MYIIGIVSKLYHPRCKKKIQNETKKNDRTNMFTFVIMYLENI